MRRLLFAVLLLAPVPALASPCTAQRLTGTWSLGSIRSADAADGVSYRFRVEGERLMLLRDGQPFEGFVCRIADRREAGVAAGNMVLSNLSGRPALRRVQRRLN